MTDEQLADLHQVLATYHRGRARQAAIGVTRQYHYDLAQRLADEVLADTQALGGNRATSRAQQA